MGLIEQQGGAVFGAEGRQDRHIHTGALHREEALAQYQQPLSGSAPAGCLQLGVELGQVVVGEALQPGTAGAHPGEQGVVDQPVGQHQAVAIGQGPYRRQVCLKAAGK